ncbi:hypothetical protein [Rhodococcus sp. 24CO]|uniref:hypothetical protein n=1 Tax=Rhodococcus sp. 24CO TaxID=3117460 RepID=UPI003D33374C
MSAVPLKVVRKKLAHEAILDKIDREHLSINTDEVETDREMRNMSPLSVLFSKSERLRVLDLLVERTRE